MATITEQESVRYKLVQDHVIRYFRAVYGDDFAFRAPETFLSWLERWMLYTASIGDGADSMAEQTIQEIEEWATTRRSDDGDGDP